MQITSASSHMCSQWHLHIISRPSIISGNSLQLKAYLPLWCLTMALHSMEMTSRNLPMNLTLCTPHHHCIFINPMDSLRLWWRRSKCLQENWWIPKCSGESITSAMKTPPSQQIFLLQLRYFMDILHKEQSFQDHPNQSAYVRFSRDSLKFRIDRRNSLTKPTELRIYEFSRLRSKYSSSQTNKGQAPWNGWLELWLKSWIVVILTWSRPQWQSLQEK